MEHRHAPDEALGERAAERPELEQRAQLAVERQERVAHAVAAAEHHALEAALELAQERQRHREHEQQDQRVARERRQLGDGRRGGGVPLEQLVERPARREQDRRERGRGQQVEDRAPREQADVHQAVADDRHAEREREDRVGRDADRVEPVPARDEADEVHGAAQQADGDAQDDEERAVAPEARDLRAVGAEEPDQAEDQVALEVDEERRVERARRGHEAPRRDVHAAQEPVGRAHGEEQGGERVAGDERRPGAPRVEEREHVVVEEHGDRDHADVEEVLPGHRGLDARRRAQAEDAEVPDGEPGGEVREEEVPGAPAVGHERAAEEQQVQAEGQERQELMDEHRAPRGRGTGSRPARAAPASRPRGSRTRGCPSAGPRRCAPRAGGPRGGSRCGAGR